jgi:hypothetical protein
VAQGYTNKEIAERMHSERTPDGHLAERGVEATSKTSEQAGFQSTCPDRGLGDPKPAT